MESSNSSLTLFLQPVAPCLADDAISEILINGHEQVAAKAELDAAEAEYERRREEAMRPGARGPERGRAGMDLAQAGLPKA